MKRVVSFLFLMIIMTFCPSTAHSASVQKQIVTEQGFETGYEYSKRGFASAVALGDVSVVDNFLKAGFNPNEKVAGMPIAFYAVFNEKNDVLEKLLKAGANPNTSWGKVSLLTASIELNNIGAVKILSENGADINKTTFKLTPLNYALYQKHSEIASLLLDKGAVADKKSLNFAKKRCKNDDLVKKISGILEKK